MSTGAVIETRGLTKRFGSTIALDAVSVAVRPGITGLLGGNGAGKTTLFSVVLGLLASDAGDVAVLGLDPAAMGPDVRARVGWSPEHHRLPSEMKANDFVVHLARVHGIPRRDAVARASDALWLVGLGEERFRPLGTLSTGQRQRVKLAQAVAHDPALVLLDEPTDGLDPRQRDEMLGLIRRIGTERGISVVLSSHVLDEVERVCDRAVLLDAGRVVGDGSLDELRGEGQGVEVEVVDHAGAVASDLVAAGCQVAVAGTRLRLHAATLPAGDDLHRVLVESIVRHDAGLRRLSPRTRSLEDVFLQVSE